MDDIEIIRCAFSEYVKERKITNPSEEQYILFRDGFTIAVKMMMRETLNQLINNY